MKITVDELTTIGITFTLLAVAIIIFWGVIVPYIQNMVKKNE